jgi:mono/diheme cytochrome c family protein
MPIRSNPRSSLRSMPRPMQVAALLAAACIVGSPGACVGASVGASVDASVAAIKQAPASVLAQLGAPAKASEAAETQAPAPASTSPAPTPAASAQSAQATFSQARLDYGRYMTLVGACMACHTRPGGQPFEGGLAIDTAFGTLYTPNITPAKDAGIGDFSDADFVRALHDGIAPNGKPYYPALPYAFYTKVEDADLLAIKDYLSTLEPSQYQPPKHQLRWPFDLRDLLFGWQELYLQRARFHPNADKSEVWNRGAYLVEGLGHCGACHRPRHGAAATASKEAMSGALIDGWFAPNLAADLSDGLDKWSVEALASYLGTGLAAPTTSDEGPRSAALGPMAEVVHDNLSKLASSDLHAMAVYLKDLPPKQAPSNAPPVPQQLSAETYTMGRKLYEGYCSSCHQRHGQGLAPYFPALRGNAAVTLEVPDDIIKTLLLGAPSDPSQAYSAHVVMPSFGSVLNDAQIAAITSFIRASWGNDAAPVKPEQVSQLRSQP